MNFLSAFGDLPRIQTRKALLLLDFQNDFVRPTGALYVSNTPEVLEILPQLASAFRRTGDVVWVRSYYESRQPLISPDEQDVVVLSGAGDPQKDEQNPVHEEAFLSTDPPACCLPQTTGAQYPAPLLAAIDTSSDILIEKSEYSALQSPGLVLSLRTRFVTELYLCGSLSNASVHATALDAVRHGFSITLVEDCLGYRSFSRHEEAMRRMADILGASGITSDELLTELDREETDEIAASEPRPARTVPPSGIEVDLEVLDVKRSSIDTTRHSPRRRRLDEILAEMSDDEDGSLKELVELTRERARTRYNQEKHMHASESGKSAVRTKVRRRHDQKDGESAAQPTDSRRVRKTKPTMNICRPGDVIGEGDSKIVYDLDLPEGAFEKIRDEVAWQKMYHMSGQVPRLVAVQGKHSPDGSIPIYRHPADESPPLLPFTPVVDKVRAIVERILGHPLNHVLIQLYRDGQDRISEHSDKTLDIVRGSSICNVSLGAQRVMVLRAKGTEKEEEGSGRLTQRVPMPHESLFVLGEKTNARWLHGIKADKRQESEKSVEERAYEGQRISLTFRHIGTFLDPTGDIIWGQGAVSKVQGEAHPVIHGEPDETERLVRAFGEENRAIDFNWDAVYGNGFDVVNFVTATSAKLIPAEDEIANLRVQIGLSENGIRYDTTPLGAVPGENVNLPLYIDADGTQIAGATDILRYLAQRAPKSERPGMEMLSGGKKLSDIDALLEEWRRHSGNDELDALLPWEDALDGQYYLGGNSLTIDDCALWPVLRDIVQKRGPLSDKTYPNLSQYYTRVGKRGIVKTVLEELK
jgi:nicotinamidase-related amidase/glutathione S-transferase/alkylated DNA repair dioxygenase AlkB